MKKVILASQSPRRKQLLESLGIPFEAIPADIDETMNLENDLRQEIQNLSYRKASALLKDHPECIIIGSDTIVVKDNEVLGKPEDRKDAERMLEMLSGSTHQVMTGICILSNRKVWTNVTVSDVTFAPLSKEEIDAYIDSGEAYDKAGAYGIQGYAGRFITQIRGDFYSIMGFPLNLVYEEMKNLETY